jgi:hypothetical protein
VGLFSTKKKSQRLAKAKAEWDAAATRYTGVTGPLLRCTGVVTASPDALEARQRHQGGADIILWRYFEYFALAEEDYKIILKAGEPYFWFFAIDCENSEERARWRQLLRDLGVSERKYAALALPRWIRPTP